jgi:phosphoribosyl-ATP pyrophosphohydrolase
MDSNDKKFAKKLYNFFELLRDSNNFPNSKTAKLLSQKTATFFCKRVKEEFDELQGCINGTHRHSNNFQADFILESSQVFYWLALASISKKRSFDEFLKKNLTELKKLKYLHQKNKIPFNKMLKKDLKECEKKYNLVASTK